MRLIDEWRVVLRRAWSGRLMLLAVIAPSSPVGWGSVQTLANNALSWSPVTAISSSLSTMYN